MLSSFPYAYVFNYSHCILGTETNVHLVRIDRRSLEWASLWITWQKAWNVDESWMDMFSRRFSYLYKPTSLCSISPTVKSRHSTKQIKSNFHKLQSSVYEPVGNKKVSMTGDFVCCSSGICLSDHLYSMVKLVTLTCLKIKPIIIYFSSPRKRNLSFFFHLYEE